MDPWCRKERRRQRNREKKRRNQRLTTESCKFVQHKNTKNAKIQNTTNAKIQKIQAWPQTPFCLQISLHLENNSRQWLACSPQVQPNLCTLKNKNLYKDKEFTNNNISDDDLYAVPQFSGQPNLLLPSLTIFLPIFLISSHLHLLIHLSHPPPLLLDHLQWTHIGSPLLIKSWTIFSEHTCKKLKSNLLFQLILFSSHVYDFDDWSIWTKTPLPQSIFTFHPWPHLPRL